MTKKGKSRYEGEIGERRITNFSIISDVVFKEKISFQKNLWFDVSVD